MEIYFVKQPVMHVQYGYLCNKTTPVNLQGVLYKPTATDRIWHLPGQAPKVRAMLGWLTKARFSTKNLMLCDSDALLPSFREVSTEPE